VASISPFFYRPHLQFQPVVELIAVALLLLLLALLERQPLLRNPRKTGPTPSDRAYRHEPAVRSSVPREDERVPFPDARRAAVPFALFREVISYTRDWLPILLALAAFREMELFLPASYPRTYEIEWIQQDHLLLSTWHLKSALESLGGFVPSFLELCYFLVYGLPEVCVLILYFRLRRESVDRFLFVYLSGALLAYSLFPFFPSQPPRIAFAGADDPSYNGWIRQLNLYTLENTTIHSAVFPSAHVSSAFAAAWAMFLLIPERKLIGLGLLIYAVVVSISTIYGRYHYAADVVGGFGVSLIAGLLGLLLRNRLAHSLNVPA
jgi:membrane-associated phospholipid phosphatase